MATKGSAWGTTDGLQGSAPGPKALTGSLAKLRLGTLGETKLQQLFFVLLLIYIYMFVARLPELIPWARIGFLVQPILLVGLFMTDQLTVLLKSRSGKWLTGLIVWMALCVPFSYWPGGSFQTLIKGIQALVLAAFILGFVQSYRDLRRILFAIGLASGTIAILSFFVQATINNRLGFGGTATLADPNYFALYLLVGGAFLVLAVTQSRGIPRLIAIFLIPINLAGIMRSGSRAGLLSLLVGLVMFFLFASARQRGVLAVLAVLGAVAAMALLPSDIKHRFLDIFASGSSAKNSYYQEMEGSNPWEASVEASSAQASTEARRYLFIRGVELTFKHPVLGVGPEQFQVAEAEDASAHGIRGAWRFTHNTYLQYSSECGFPGLILFVGSLVLGYRGLSAIRKRGPSREIRQTAMYMQVAYVMLMIGAFFLSMGYGGLPFVLIAVSEAFKRAVKRQQQQLSHSEVLQPQAA